MADNLPPSPAPAPTPGPRPTLPGSGLTGRLRSTTTAPALKKGAGKIVVMLSSVAKPPPAGTQALPPITPPTPGAKLEAKVPPSLTNRPPLPPKTVVPVNELPSPSRPQLSATTYVKLPPKTAMPNWSSLSGKPVAPTPTAAATPVSAASPPPLPIKVPELKKPGAQHIPPIKLNEPPPRQSEAEESIFLQGLPDPTPKPEPLKDPAMPNSSAPPSPLAAPVPEGEPVSLDLFEHSQKAAPQPAPSVSTPEAKSPSPTPLVAPPLVPPQRRSPPPLTTAPLPSVRPPPVPLAANPVETAPEPPPQLYVAPRMLERPAEPPVERLPPPFALKPAESDKPPASPLQVAPPMVEKAPEPMAEKLPPPLVAKPVDDPAPPSAPLQVAPPMLEKTPEPVAEKLPAPLPIEARASEAPPPLPEISPVAETPALILPNAPPPKASLPPTSPAARRGLGWFKRSTPHVISSSSQKLSPPPIVEAKPALKPPALPRSKIVLPPDPAPAPVEKAEVKAETPVPIASENVPALPSTVSEERKEPPVTNAPVSAAPGTPKPAPSPAPAAKAATVPLTRAERARKRRIWSTAAFWGLVFPASIAALFFASLHFGRDTRVEGQIIPPPGMVLDDEVWLVTDFRSLATGIAEDLALERTPLLQAIQERQDHVQRAQADVASREERIRLLQEDIAASKSEIEGIVKQARDATQRVWDVDGAEIDQEYAARQSELQRAIADRAKSLHLNYEPDDTYQSPEVWANAYRLALYQVPAGVDGVKEHAWLGEQMKAWRDFQKSLDDRKEQLREKAAQIKLGPAPKINDLNAKIDDLQQQIEATQAEEVPLKAELQQAQADLVAVQSTEAGLDDKYYKQLDALPAEAVTKHIPLQSNGRFTWIEDDVFVEGEKAHNYWIFARATRPDGRQYWALHHFEIGENQTLELSIEPGGFLSTKAILRPNLSPEEQEQ